MNVRAVILILSVISCYHPDVALAQPDSMNWEVGRVYVPRENQLAHIPLDYQPIKIEELDEQLQQLRNNYQLRQVNPFRIDTAVYVATITRDLLVSDGSFWKFDGAVPTANSEVGKVSFTLRDAKAIPENARQLSSDQRFTTDGSIEVDLSASQFQLWFGFQAASIQRDSKRSFQLEIPRAAMAQMLISTDVGVRLSSTDVVVRPITAPTEYLPADWPASLSPRPSPRQVWWMVYLSGVSQFSINLSENSDGQPPAYVHAITSAALSHQITADTLNSSATFKFATESNGQPIAFDLTPSVKIRSISVDGRMVDWRLAQSAENRTLAQLTSAAVGIGTTVEVQTVSRLTKLDGDQPLAVDKTIPADNDFKIPSIAVANSIVLSGTTTIRSDESTAVVQVYSDQEFRKSALDPTVNSANFTWQSQWSGQPPTASVKLSTQMESWTTSSFCRLNVQENSVLAHLHLSLRGSSLRSNQLRLLVHPGWTIDSVTIPSEPMFKERAFALSDHGRDEILVTWQGRPSLFSTQLEIIASAPIDPKVTSFSIKNPRIIQVPDPHRPAYWALQSSSNFRLRSNIDLLPNVVSKKDLMTWQQQLVAEDNLPIYRDLSDANSRFVFDVASGWLSASIATMIEPLGQERLRLTTRLNCQPNSGSVDRIELVLPPEHDSQDWKFSFASGDETGVPVQTELPGKDSGVNSGVADRATLELRLPISTNRPFSLQASYEMLLNNNSVEGIGLPIPGLPTATSVESTVIMPAQLAHFSDQTAVELLAATNCCSTEIEQIFSQFASQPGLLTSPEDNWVSARVDGSQSHLLRLTSASVNQRSSWIWSETVRHELTQPGHCRHTLDLDIQSGSSNSITLELPEDWQPDLLVVDEAERQDFFWHAGKLEVDLPINRRSHLKIQFRSRGPHLGWLNRLSIATPQYDVPVLQRSEQLQLPLAYLALIPPKATRLPAIIDRLQPWMWWQMFTPEPLFNSLDQAEDLFRPTYNLTNRQRDDQHRIWVVNRDSLATLLLTVLLVCAALNWFLIHRSVRGWWLCNLTVLILVIVLPEPIAKLGQLLLLAALLGGLARLIEVVTRRPSSTFRQGPLSSPRVTASLVLVAAFGPSCSSQLIEQNSIDKPTKIYGVVIPYEGSSDDPKGEQAWIPKELQELLPGTGKNSLNKQASPKILSANYVLKLRQNPRDNTSVQELSVELRILATDTSSELLLPYLPQSLPLGSPPELNGQARLPGIRFELTAEGIIFRPDTVGVMTVGFSFQPIVENSAEQKFKFVATVPPIPNATMRIVPNSQTSGININARGGIQRLPSGDYIAYLGAINELRLEWAENDRSSSTIATEYTTETWVRSQADSISVACQLTIERGRSLPEEFELIVDADWEPVGTKWGDAELVSSTISSTLKRRVVRIRLLESAGTTCHVRMVLAPKSNLGSTALDVPFVSLDRVASKGKLFWWSPDPKSNWTAEGLELMPTRTSSSDWGELKIAQERTGYQVVGSGVRLRHQATSNSSLVEVSALHIFVSHTELEYEATWERLSSIYEELVVSIPDGSEIKRLEVNGKVSTAFGRQPGTLRIPLINAINARIKLVLELPPMQNVVQQLPRVHLKNLQTRQSNYQIYRGTGLDVQLLPTNSGLVFTNSATTNKRPSLDKLETLVGEANLPPELLNESSLAATLDVRRRPATPHQSFIEYLTRTGNGWKATVKCTWDAQATGLDYAFFDVPLSLRDNIETGSQVCIFKPHEDSTRANLCIPVPAAEAGIPRSVEFSFSVTAIVSARSITLPRITANHGFVTTPVVALPSVIDGREVRWTKTGRAVEPSWFGQAAVEKLPDLEYLSLLPNQTKLVWQSSESSLQNTHVELMWLDITSSTNNKMAGIVSYWIAPKSQVTQHFEIPEGCEILGVDCGNRRTTWSVEGDRLRVTLQPNTVPLSVRIMAQWQFNSNQPSSVVRVPKPLNATDPGQLFLSMAENSNWSVVNDSSVTSVDSDAVVDHWAAIVIEAADSLVGMPERQSSNWLAAWYPANFRIRRDFLVDLPAQQTQLSTFDINDDGEISVGEIWDRTETLARNADYAIDAADTSSVPGDLTSTKWRIDGGEIKFSQRAGTVRYDAPQWLAAILFVGLGVLLLLVGSKLRSWLLLVLANHPWFYWTLLSAVLWLALPISWPSWFVLGLSLWMWITQLMENRRRSRRFGFY